MHERAAPSPTGVSDRSRLDELIRTIATLSSSEPDVAPSTRPRLLERLARLDTDADRLSLRLSAGDPLDDELLTACEVEAGELRWWWRPTVRER